MTDDQIKHMVSRFLGWKLPEHFRPDGGITFTPDFNVGTPWPMKHQPSGTNLFDATQADEMVRYLIKEMPFPNPPTDVPAISRLSGEGLKELRGALEDVVATSKSGADTISFLMQLNRLARRCAAALLASPTPAPRTPGDDLNEADGTDTTASVDQVGALRGALQSNLEFLVMVIASLGRDRGTNRLDGTLDSLTNLAVDLDPKTRQALALTSKSGG